MNLKACIGVAPIAWLNDDLPELSGKTTLETCLREAASAGYTGIELGGSFPKSSAKLGPLLEKYSLQLCSGWYSGTLLGNDLEAEKDKVREQLNLFIELKSPCLAYGETYGTIQNLRNTPLSNRIKLDAGQIIEYGNKLTQFAEWCCGQGMPLSFHHHMGTAIETWQELDVLMENTGEAVGLLYDPGHMAFANGNVMEVIEKYGKRITHFHAKDMRLNVKESLDPLRDSFLDAVIKGVFTVPGDGVIDFDIMIRSLVKVGYKGWFVVEAEQDPELAPPLEYACKGYAEIRKCLIQAGYSLEENN